ncbi:hypothetical protein M0R45_027217 [Rubus argutus]|uniref:non-specific serine/threonine protein kinase n=1 Tax=Rubus argutus TaxID=59490 RepID=A0AAW1X3A3_RUBAR
MKEISVMKSLRGHPQCCHSLCPGPIMDMGRTKEALLVMEFCDKDVCTAVFAMHTQSPPIAHRDLKAENLLLGSRMDYGIVKHTTPAYRAPEMWDLFRRELINEKVDIWALGCLLFRICYFKSAFDGESKLQILNGNYRIPELPKYSSSLTDLIRDMLQASPDDRPDITQVWFRVNEQLPVVYRVFT